MRQARPVTWSAGGSHRHWVPTPLRKLGKKEEFLEAVIADSPGLLGLESFREGFFGPLVSFRRVALESTQGRSIEADVVLLTASGHVVIVEVKLGDNDELHDRRVVAQVIDYATSLSRYDRAGLANLFGAEAGESWLQVVARHFPAAADPAELAETLYERCRDGEVRIVIACDIAPDTAPNLVKAMGLQASLGFELKLVEIVPYTSGTVSDILFVPRDTAQTEVVATTRVVVEYQGPQQPKVSIVAPSAEDVAERVRDAKTTGRRAWDESTFFADAKARLAPDEYDAVRALYDFTAKNATQVKWGTGAQRGSFNPRFGGVSERSPYSVYSDGTLQLSYGWLDDDDCAKTIRELLAERLHTTLGIEPDLKGWPTCDVARWKMNLDKLLRVLRETLATQA